MRGVSKGIFGILIFFISLIFILLGVMSFAFNLDAFMGFMINKRPSNHKT